MNQKLNPRHERFCVEYSKTGNAAAAYQSAVFKSKSRESAQANSSRLLADEKIQARLRELAEELKSESIADVEELQVGLTKIFRGEVTQTQMTPKGEIMELPVSVKDRLKAAEILCKTFGAFLNRQELAISENVPVVIIDDIK